MLYAVCKQAVNVLNVKLDMGDHIVVFYGIFYSYHEREFYQYVWFDTAHPWLVPDPWLALRHV